MTPDSNVLSLAKIARDSGIFARLSTHGITHGDGLANPGAILARGRDAASFLHSQVTNEVDALAPGAGNFSARVNRQGQLVQSFSLHRLPDDESEIPAFLMLLERTQVDSLIEDFEHFLFSDDVALSNISADYDWFVMQGPKVPEVTKSALEDSAAALSPHGVRSLDGNGLLISRSLTGDIGMLIALSRSEAEKSANLAERLEAKSAEAGLAILEEPDLSRVIEVLRIEAGQVRVGPDTKGRKCILPETGLEQHAVSYTKGCYLGQEVIARIRTYGSLPYGLRGLIFETESGRDELSDRGPWLEQLPAPGENLVSTDDGKTIGQIVSRTLSPLVGGPIAFAYLDKKHRTPGREVRFETNSGTVAARVTLLPFYNAPDRDQRVAFLYDKGVRTFAKGKEEAALEFLEDALRLDPGFADGYEAIGVILGRSERFHEAIDFFKRLEEIAPNVALVNTNLSLYFMKIGDKTSAEREAAKAMQKSLAEGSGSTESAAEIAEQMSEKERADASRKKKMFAMVLEIDAEDPVALYGLGNAHATLEEWADAEAAYARASLADSSNSAVFLAHGKALEALERPGEAESVYRNGMEVASRKGDLMPLKEMENRVLLLSAMSGNEIKREIQ
jgi:folate-binding protein YgfZ